MSERTLIDTSAWVRFFRKGAENKGIADEVEHLLDDGQACYTEPVYVELVIGARLPGGLELLKDSFLSLPVAKIEEGDWRLAWELVYLLRKKGLRVDVADLLVAAKAINNDVRVFHNDKHFSWIAKISRLREYSFLGDKEDR